MAADLLTSPSIAGSILLIVLGAVAAAINSVAGGGSLLSFPALVALGIPELRANATNTTALWPGSLAGSIGFIGQFSRTGKYISMLALPTLLGSIAGSALLLNTPKRIFAIAVPILLLFASIVLTFQKQIRERTLYRRGPVKPWAGMLFQALISVYGGYFGAGMGILMLASLGMMMEGDIHELNAIKSVLGVVINLTATLIFIANGLVILHVALALTIGSVIGGYAAARLSLKVEAERLRVAILILGYLITGWFTYRVVFL